jgi:hypothetical protein
MIDVNKYDLIGNSIGVKNYVYPKFYTFLVTENDYQNEFVYRYFVQKINDSSVIEVDSKNYNNIQKNLFNKVVVTWHLIGPARNVYVNGKLYEQGVYEKNLKEINSAAQSMPNLKNIITNYTQYSKPRKG